MENYGSNESKDSKTSTTESSPARPSRETAGPAKPNAVKAQSLAELLIHTDAVADQHRVIWEREESAKESKESKTDKKDSRKPPVVAPSPAPESKIRTEARPETERSTEDAPLDELEADEARAIAEQYAAGRGAELRDEQAQLPPDSPERAAAAANAAMIRKLAEKLRAEPDGDPRRAVAEAADEVIAEDNLGTVEQARAALSTAEAVPPDDDEPVDTAKRSSGATTTPPRPPAVGGGGQPPTGPPRYPFAPGFPGSPGGPGGFNPNQPGSTGSPNIYPSASMTTLEAQYYARQAENRGLLVGGIVGYLIGRRRGRIKTEKRLLPIQKKLEKAVTGLHDTIADRERQIRTLATQKARATRIAGSALRPVRSETAVPMSRPVEAIVPAPTERAQRFEAVPLPVPTAETDPARSRPPEGSPDQRVERLRPAELLKAAETVLIEGASLRQIYDTHRITEKGLRHIMTEYLRGGDVKKALDEELTIKELSYERDPQLRDKLPIGSKLKPGDGTGVHRSIRPRLPFAAEPSAPADPASGADKSDGRSTSSPKADNLLQGTLLRAWVVLIVVLVILATILLFR